MPHAEYGSVGVPEAANVVRPPESTVDPACGRGPKSGGRAAGRAVSMPLAVQQSEEVRPMNAGFVWVLPLPATVGRLS